MSTSTVCCIDDLERLGQARLDKNTNGYYNSGADAEQTLRDNVSAYQRSVATDGGAAYDGHSW